MKLQKYIVILKRTATSASTSFLDHRIKHCSAGWKRRELSVSHPLSKHLWNGNLPNLWVWGLGEIVIQQDFTRQNSTCTMTVSCWKPPPHLCCRRWVLLTTTGQADHSAITFTLIGTLLLFSSTVTPPLFWWLPHLVPLHQDYPKPVLFISKAHKKISCCYDHPTHLKPPPWSSAGFCIPTSHSNSLYLRGKNFIWTFQSQEPSLCHRSITAVSLGQRQTPERREDEDLAHTRRSRM